jgi:hypothetical protein
MDLMASAIEAFYLFKEGIYRDAHKARRNGFSWNFRCGRRDLCGE